MAVYFDHQVQTPEGSAYRHELLKWHPKFQLLAVASYNEMAGGEVNIFFEEGERTKDTPIRKASYHVTKLSWHPSRKILGVGWSSGDVSIWNLMDSKAEVFTVNSTTNAEVAGLEWSSEGSRILITDSSGLVLIYKTDNRGHPQATPFSKNKLKEPIRCVVLRPSVSTEKTDSSAAPSGNKLESDEPDSLDLFGFKKHGRAAAAQTDSATFFMGGDTGGVYCLRESGVADECFDLQKRIVQLLYHKHKNVLITITDDLNLCQHHVAPDCTLKELSKVKLSSKNQKLNIIWAGIGILAISSGESLVRLWDLDNEDNCVLSLSTDKGYNANDTINCISYCCTTGILAGGTNLGNIAMWRPSKVIITDLSEQFKLQPPSTLQGSVTGIQWADTANMLAVSTTKDVFVLKEQIMCVHMKNGMIGVQTSQNTISVTKIDKLSTFEIQPEKFQPKGIFFGQEHLACWDGREVLIYENVDSGTSSVQTGKFLTNSTVIALHSQSVYLCEPTKVQVKTLKGTVKQTLLLADEENDPCSLDVSGNFLAVGTTTGFLRVYDLSRREAKLQSHPKYVAEGVVDFGTIVSVKVNVAGNRVSCTMKKTDGSPDPRLYVWDLETDSIIYFDFGAAVTDQEEYENQTASAAGQKKEESRFCKDLKSRYPIFHTWESADPRFLIAEAVPLREIVGRENPNKLKTNEMSESMIASFFVTGENGILVQDAFPSGSACEKLIGLEIPYMYFVKKSDFVGDLKSGITEFGDLEKAITRHVIRRTCRDFVGLESADKSTKEAMLNFSYYLTVGNMDEAFKAIKLIKSESVWENMAQMCVKTQRLDVAAVCMGNMGNARGARALRKALQNPAFESEAKVAVLAVQLGMIEDAERLYYNGKRYDMVNKLQQASNNWKKAIEIADNQDRVHLRNTYYSYAKHLESLGAIQGAIEFFEKSDTHRFEVPRMLIDNPMVLKQYVEKTKEPRLQRWWAQYAESLGELESAKQFYSSAGDFLSVIRLLCYSGDVETAAKVANDSSDEAACYHLARQYENSGRYQEAVHFFTKARAYTSAIKLCKEHGMDDKIAQLALLGKDSDMLEAAKFYENKTGHADKSVMLYHKAGMFGRALDLAFRTEQFSALDLIASDLDENSDPRVLERCAEFFVQNQQYTKAVQLLGYAKKYADAIDLCARKNVPITDQFAELLTPTKEAVPDALTRNKLMEQLADVCMQQAVYHYAAKKYTQAGNRTQAMKALLKSGDTEKIIFFANTARTKEIYIMAGNYLQTLDWKQEPEIMKSIVTFYTKGQAPESLAGFYDACAQVEIDEYRDYEKAMIALQEAAKCLTKSRDPMQMENRITDINKKIELIRQFLNIRTIYESDPAEAMKQLQTLSQEKNVNEAVRLGDIYAVLIIHNFKKDNYKKAHSYVEELRKRNPRLNIARYVKPQMIERIYQEVNLPTPVLNSTGTEQTENGQTGDEFVVPESQGLQRKMNLNETLGIENGAA